MKNKAILILLILVTTIGFSQKYYTDSGLTEFNGSKAAFEPIKAQNSSTISLFNVESWITPSVGRALMSLSKKKN